MNVSALWTYRTTVIGVTDMDGTSLAPSGETNIGLLNVVDVDIKEGVIDLALRVRPGRVHPCGV
jgi:hypothetical protein